MNAITCSNCTERLINLFDDLIIHFYSLFIYFIIFIMYLTPSSRLEDELRIFVGLGWLRLGLLSNSSNAFWNFDSMIRQA